MRTCPPRHAPAFPISPLQEFMRMLLPKDLRFRVSRLSADAGPATTVTGAGAGAAAVAVAAVVAPPGAISSAVAAAASSTSTVALPVSHGAGGDEPAAASPAAHVAEDSVALQAGAAQLPGMCSE